LGKKRKLLFLFFWLERPFWLETNKKKMRARFDKKGLSSVFRLEAQFAGCSNFQCKKV